MKTRLLISIGSGLSILVLGAGIPLESVQALPYQDPVPRSRVINDVAFGSCLRQNRAVPILDSIVENNPDLFVFLGDNVYADTTSPEEMRSAYLALGEKPGFRRLQKEAGVHAIWDDHDYGANDAGGDFSFRKGAEKIFKEFWGMENRIPYKDREGVYASFLYRTGGVHPIKVQLILLDTRSFRSPLKKKPWWQSFLGLGNTGPYVPDRNEEKTILGKEQWKWLEYQFSIQADLRIVASSIQVLSSSNGWESWSNMPLQKEQLLNLAVEQSAPVVFISGDRHFAEISALRFKNRTFYDVTSSSLNQPLFFEDEKNPYRRGERFPGANFGRIRIDDTSRNWTLKLQILDEKGAVVLNEEYNP